MPRARRPSYLAGGDFLAHDPMIDFIRLAYARVAALARRFLAPVSETERTRAADVSCSATNDGDAAARDASMRAARRATDALDARSDAKSPPRR